MQKTRYFLDPLPSTNQYLISKCVNGKITELGVRTINYLIENWGKKHSCAEDIIEGLQDHAEIELFD